MKVQIHNLLSPEFAPNIGAAYLKKYKAIALGFLFFSITISWYKEPETKTE
jgi:hypothetical protein